MTEPDYQQKSVQVLLEILKWIKVSSIPNVKKILLDTLEDDKAKIAYENSDGRSSQEVASLAGVNYVTISRWWKNWVRIGIAEPISARGGERAIRSFSLADFGIEVEVPTTPKPAKKETSPNESGKNAIKNEGEEVAT